MKNLDPYPGKPRILFIGLPDSTHTHSWIDLLQGSGEFNVRLFSTSPGYPPPDWWVPSYILSPPASTQNASTHIYLHRQSEKSIGRLHRSGLALFWFSLRSYRKIANFFGRFLDIPPLGLEVYSDNPEDTFKAWQISVAKQMPYNPAIQRMYAEHWLAEVIREWKPDIIHTLGIFDNQGGAFYLNVREKYGLAGYGQWVVQARGGPDIALYRNLEDKRDILVKILDQCSSFIADNDLNYQYANALGLDSGKSASLGAVPGTGGIDIESLSKRASNPVSKRERIILWPKAYECPQSKALPVLEGIKVAWPDIQPCTLVMTAAAPEVEMWARTLPAEVFVQLDIRKRISRCELLDLMGRARVILMPSLSDGVPNTLYEAMASGSFPILSPLPTITNIVREEENVLFARNLYPDEIAAALVRAMWDDDLIDNAADRNREVVVQYADRQRLRGQVAAYYHDLVSGRQQAGK